jgi:putative transposase
MPTRRVTFRLYPTEVQEQKLRWARKMHKDLYNSALANRKTQYQRFGNSVDYFQQQGSLPAFKEVWTEYKLLNAGSLQATLKRVEFAYQRFFQGLAKYPRFKSIRHYSGWTYPDGRQGFKAHTTGVNGYLKLGDLDIEIQMRGKARVWGRPTTCTILYRNNKWHASITVEVAVIKRELGLGAIGIDIGCKSATQSINYSPTRLCPSRQTTPRMGMGYINKGGCERNRVERLINRLKPFWRVATRNRVEGTQLSSHVDYCWHPHVVVKLRDTP